MHKILPWDAPTICTPGTANSENVVFGLVCYWILIGLGLLRVDSHKMDSERMDSQGWILEGWVLKAGSQGWIFKGLILNCRRPAGRPAAWPRARMPWGLGPLAAGRPAGRRRLAGGN